MLNVGDLRAFASNFGKWLYKVNPKLDDAQLKTTIQQFVTNAPLSVGEHSALGFEEFCQEAARGYVEEKRTEQGPDTD